VLNPNIANQRDRVYQLKSYELWNQYHRVEKKLPDGCTNWYMAIDKIHQMAKAAAFEQFPSTMTDAQNPNAYRAPGGSAKAPAAPGTDSSGKAQRKARLDALQTD
jgi:hypothetical protein